MGCSECHNHKFDPVLTKDFYSMKAFFADVKEEGLIPDSGPDAFAPKMFVYKPGEKERIDSLQQSIQSAKDAVDRKADSLTKERQVWEKDLLAHAAAGDLVWTYPIPTSASATKAKLSVQTEANEKDDKAHPLVATTGGPGLVIASGPNPDNETYSVTVRPGAGVWTSLGLEVDTDSSLPGADISRGSDRFVISDIDATYSAKGHRSGKKINFVFAYSTVPPPKGYPAEAVLDGNPKTGFGLIGKPKPPLLILRFAEPLHTSAASTLTVQIHQDSEYRQATIGRFRIGLSKGTYSWANNPKPKSDTDKAAADKAAKPPEQDKNLASSTKPAATEKAANPPKEDQDDEDEVDADSERTAGLPENRSGHWRSRSEAF